jgi:GNAT superfamily N-acetyltransferase
MPNKYKITKIEILNDDVFRQCCRVANGVAGDAEYIYQTLRWTVNTMHNPMFANISRNTVRGFIKGRFETVPDYTGIENINHPIRLEHLYVDFELHRRGIGRALLESFTKYACDNGADYMFLRSSESAVGFYKKFGFETIGWEKLMGKRL